MDLDSSSAGASLGDCYKNLLNREKIQLNKRTRCPPKENQITYNVGKHTMCNLEKCLNHQPKWPYPILLSH